VALGLELKSGGRSPIESWCADFISETSNRIAERSSRSAYSSVTYSNHPASHSVSAGPLAIQAVTAGVVPCSFEPPQGNVVIEKGRFDRFLEDLNNPSEDRDEEE
jgi:hypothetical protein